MKKIDKDPFSSGSEHSWWETRNCDKCWKASHIKRGSDPDLPDWTPYRCAIQREIDFRRFGDEPISQRTYDICQMSDCPYRQEQRPRKKYEKFKNEPKLFEDNA